MNNILGNKLVIIAGLPASGKTTYLAALWHLMTARTHATELTFDSLIKGNHKHLNELAERWRQGLVQIHTETAANRVVDMNLLDQSGKKVRLSFPDVSGESYRDMWVARDCTSQLADLLKGGNGLMLFVNADSIERPLLTVELAAQAQAVGAPLTPGEKEPWKAKKSPTQVQLVDLLQLCRISPLAIKTRRVSVVLSAWDKVAVEQRTPEQFLHEQLPLLYQYLKSAADDWEWRVFGVSAQGGDYIREDKPPTKDELARVEELRSMIDPVNRISVVSDIDQSHDLTEPLAWLIA